MNLKCLFQGHDYKKVRTEWFPNNTDMYYASNYANVPIQYTEHDIFRCQRCLKEKAIYTGKSEIR